MTGNRIACGHLAELDEPQIPLRFDATESERRKQDGIEQAIRDQEWAAKAMEVIRQVAIEHEEFTADEIREEAQRSGLEAPSRYAWGGIQNAAARAGVCELTGRMVKSERVSSHARRQPVWRSLIFRGDAA